MRFGFLTVTMLALAFFAFGKEKEKKNPGTIQNESLSEYLLRMQQQSATAAAATTGSLWTDGGRLADASADYKARHAGDLVTIVVVQDITATNAGSVSSARNFSASSGITALPAQLKTTKCRQPVFSNFGFFIDRQGTSSDDFEFADQPGGARGRGHAERSHGD